MKKRISTLMAIILVALVFSCKKNDPEPTFQVVSIRAGNIDLKIGTTATDVLVNSSITIAFDESIDPTTATVNSIKISKNNVAVPLGIVVLGEIVILKPTSDFEFDTTYSLTIDGGLKSDKGYALAKGSTFSFHTNI